jgi:hypothetical protein
LGITGRHIQVKYPVNLGFQKQSKVLSFNVKTAGDWLKLKRLEKNLTPGHVAGKMGSQGWASAVERLRPGWAGTTLTGW